MQLLAWPEIRLEGWQHFVEFVSGHCAENLPLRPKYLWRGQSQDWPLRTSLQRLLLPQASFTEAIALEEQLYRNFAIRCPTFLPNALLPNSDDIFSWWGLMQHFGAPTRFLDWTESPYVAAYFSAVTDWNMDGSIYLVSGTALVDDMEAKFQPLLKTGKDIRELLRQSDAPRALMPFYSWRMNEREMAQQGRYTFSTYLLEDQDVSVRRILTASSNSSGTTLLRIILPAAMKSVFLEHLRHLNVTAQALFPGLDGLGRSLTEAAKLLARRP